MQPRLNNLIMLEIYNLGFVLVLVRWNKSNKN